MTSAPATSKSVLSSGVPELIAILSLVVGTTPVFQLVATFQRLEVVPVQLMGVTVILITFELAAVVQSLLQVTLASLLNQVVLVRAAGSYVVEVAPVISENPVVELVVEDCHLYSRVPVCPVGSEVLVNALGLKGEVPVCEVAMVPPEVGSTQVGAVG